MRLRCGLNPAIQNFRRTTATRPSKPPPNRVKVPGSGTGGEFHWPPHTLLPPEFRRGHLRLPLFPAEQMLVRDFNNMGAIMGAGAGKAQDIPAVFLRAKGPGRKMTLDRGKIVFREGEPSDSVYFILAGRIRLSVAAPTGKEATVALLGRNELFGEQCLLLGSNTRVTTARALSAADVLKFELETMTALLKSDTELADFVLKRVIARMAQYEQALVHQILNNTERRLARVLLHLCKYDSASPEPIVIENVSQELLAEMIGASRSKTNGFMTRFRRLGYIEYTGRRIVVKPSLVSVLLQPEGQSRT